MCSEQRKQRRRRLGRNTVGPATGRGSVWPDRREGGPEARPQCQVGRPCDESGLHPDDGGGQSWVCSERGTCSDLH